METKQQKVVAFIAPPGAGKGTQADMVAEKFGFYHLETSKILEEKMKNADPADADMIKAKRLYDAGQLVTPSLVAKLVMQAIEELYTEGKSLIFSGSFRTLEEAEKEVPLVEKLFGKDNVKFFYITLSEAESIKRNSGRRICQKNRHPIPNFPEYQNISACPWDGSPVIKRSLDKPEIIAERYRVFIIDTEPVLNYLKQQGYDVISINGEQPIEKVFEDISKHL